jgi:hypothetical protein
MEAVTGIILDLFSLIQPYLYYTTVDYDKVFRAGVSPQLSPTLIGFRRARQLTLEAVRRPLANTQQPPSLHFQRAENKTTAIAEWGKLYQENP